MQPGAEVCSKPPLQSQPQEGCALFGPWSPSLPESLAQPPLERMAAQVLTCVPRGREPLPTAGQLLQPPLRGRCPSLPISLLAAPLGWGQPPKGGHQVCWVCSSKSGSSEKLLRSVERCLKTHGELPGWRVPLLQWPVFPSPPPAPSASSGLFLLSRGLAWAPWVPRVRLQGVQAGPGRCGV